MENCIGNSPTALWDSAVIPDKLVKIVCVILQNLASASGKFETARW